MDVKNRVDSVSNKSPTEGTAGDSQNIDFEKIKQALTGAAQPQAIKPPDALGLDEVNPESVLRKIKAG